MTLSKLAIKRLTILADYMDSLPPSARKHFKMSWWLEHDGMHDHEYHSKVTRDDLMTCGTTACALGWAATIPVFRKAGLWMSSGGEVSYRDYHGIHFFEPSEGDAILNNGKGVADSLFYQNDQTPKQWARRCRKFIRKYS